jgi:hypothetical protein
MALISSGIDRVRVFELPGGIWADGQTVALPRIALVKWHSGWSDKFHQVYVDGQYAGTTVDSQQREMIVQMPASERPVRIEVFAVQPGQGDADFSSELDSSTGHSGRVRISFLRGQNLPIGATAQIYFDAGSGEIDYENPLNDCPIRLWPAWQDKAGFGMSRFAVSDFGFDGAAAVGFGKGSFGHGQFGLDADMFEWTSPPIQAGVYKFAVKVTDQVGNESTTSETDQVTVTPAAKAVEQVSVSSFDKQANQLLLKIEG